MRHVARTSYGTSPDGSIWPRRLCRGNPTKGSTRWGASSTWSAAPAGGSGCDRHVREPATLPAGRGNTLRHCTVEFARDGIGHHRPSPGRDRHCLLMILRTPETMRAYQTAIPRGVPMWTRSCVSNRAGNGVLFRPKNVVDCTGRRRTCRTQFLELRPIVSSVPAVTQDQGPSRERGLPARGRPIARSASRGQGCPRSQKGGGPNLSFVRSQVEICLLNLTDSRRVLESSDLYLDPDFPHLFPEDTVLHRFQNFHPGDFSAVRRLQSVWLQCDSIRQRPLTQHPQRPAQARLLQ